MVLLLLVVWYFCSCGCCFWRLSGRVGSGVVIGAVAGSVAVLLLLLALVVVVVLVVLVVVCGSGRVVMGRWYSCRYSYRSCRCYWPWVERTGGGSSACTEHSRLPDVHADLKMSCPILDKRVPLISSEWGRALKMKVS